MGPGLVARLASRRPVRRKGVQLDESLKWGLGSIVGPSDTASDARTFQQFNAGLKIVQQESQLVSIQPIHQVKRLDGVDPLPSKDFSDVRPVFLFDVGIVVFAIRAAATELHALALAPLVAMMVDKLRAAIRIDPAHYERQHRTNFGEHRKRRIGLCRGPHAFQSTSKQHR